jgi:hypothetical protein
MANSISIVQTSVTKTNIEGRDQTARNGCRTNTLTLPRGFAATRSGQPFSEDDRYRRSQDARSNRTSAISTLPEQPAAALTVGQQHQVRC